MWGLRSPTPRGRTESCTLHILTDVLIGAHEKKKVAVMLDDKQEHNRPSMRDRQAVYGLHLK